MSIEKMWIKFNEIVDELKEIEKTGVYQTPRVIELRRQKRELIAAMVEYHVMGLNQIRSNVNADLDMATPLFHDFVIGTAHAYGWLLNVQTN